MTSKINRTAIGYGARGEIFSYSAEGTSITMKSATPIAPKMANAMQKSGLSGTAVVYDGDKELYSFDIESLASTYEPMPDIWSKSK